DLRQLPQPDREHLRRARRVRLQERRLPRLGRLRLRPRRARPPPQQPRRTRAAQTRSGPPARAPSRQDDTRAQARRLNDDRVPGETLREAALVVAPASSFLLAGSGRRRSKESSSCWATMEAVGMAAAAKRIEVSVEDRCELERLVRSRTAERRAVERA